MPKNTMARDGYKKVVTEIATRLGPLDSPSPPSAAALTQIERLAGFFLPLQEASFYEELEQEFAEWEKAAKRAILALGFKLVTKLA
jgi:hypothetical protein